MKIVIATHLDHEGDLAIGCDIEVTDGSEIQSAMIAFGVSIGQKCGLTPSKVAELFSDLMRNAEAGGLQPTPLPLPPPGFGSKTTPKKTSDNIAAILAAAVATTAYTGIITK